jgi:glyoxylase-like metal-dependent hydrolase (beta-lactamase superfamily II)
MSDPWEVYAVKYADKTNRKRIESFIGDPHYDLPHPIDFFVWVLRRGAEVILVDSGFDQDEARDRAIPLQLDPGTALAPLGLKPEDITTLIVTHLHFDHAGGLRLFPNAHLHIQAAEMAYATGPCMCHEVLRWPYTGEHVCEAVKRLYSGRLTFHDGDAQVAEGVTVHKIGGHTKGMQCVRVLTSAGWLVLASDASHFYENMFTARPFPFVVDLDDMLDGFKRLETLVSARRLIVPGHDPLVRTHFPAGPAPHIFRLDHGPNADFTP